MASAARYTPRPPRALTEREYRGLVSAADVLIPDGAIGMRPSRQKDFRSWLERALAARRDAFELVAALADRLSQVPADRLPGELRGLAGELGSGFPELSTVVAGAYLMIDEVRAAIAYPGQGPRPPRFDEAAEEIMSGILDPVRARGRLHREVPGGGGS